MSSQRSPKCYSVFHLGGRDLDSFRDFAILPGFAGIAVHDRYQNYYNAQWKHLGGHQACCAHYPDLRIIPMWRLSALVTALPRPVRSA